jgi:hypothetical protein
MGGIRWISSMTSRILKFYMRRNERGDPPLFGIVQNHRFLRIIESPLQTRRRRGRSQPPRRTTKLIIAQLRIFRGKSSKTK